MRLIAFWWQGDCIVGAHVRDTEVETRAAVEAARLLRAKRTPETERMPVPRVGGAPYRDLTPTETERFYRWRVYQNWLAMREAFTRRVKAVRS